MDTLTARRHLAERIRKAIETDGAESIDNLSDLDQFVQEWRATPETEEDRFLDDAYHLFLHFLTDRDIRRKDPSCAEEQIREMRLLITKLEKINGGSSIQQ